MEKQRSATTSQTSSSSFWRSQFGKFLRREYTLSLTMEGWALVVTMSLIGLAALNTAAPLLYLLFSMMCAFFVLSALLASNTIRGITVERRLPRLWPAKTPLRVEVFVHNNKRLTSSYSLRVFDRFEEGGLVGAVFYDQVLPGTKALASHYECLFCKRGVYCFDRMEVASRFPFGLIERRLTFQKTWEILVLPQTISVSEKMEEVRAELGDYETQRKGQGAGLYGLREYNHSIPARDIHWKVSARRGQLIAREYESEERKRAVVILDNRIPHEDQDKMSQRFEMSIILAASVIDWLCQTRHEVELRTASGIASFSTGIPHLTRCRRCLARLQMVDPSEGKPGQLISSEEGAVHFPILFSGRVQSGHNYFPVTVDDFEDQLHNALVVNDPEDPSLRESRYVREEAWL